MSQDLNCKDRMEELHTAVISDVADELGLDDLVISSELRPLWGRDTVIGTAHTIQMVDVAYHSENHFERILESMAAIEPGNMVIRAAPADTNVGVWGELLSTAAKSLGAVGAIVDGPTRDARLIEDVGFPVWADGHSVVDSDGRCDVTEHGVPVELNGVKIHPGDVIMADYEGIIRIPPEHVEEVVNHAEEEMSTEYDVRDELASGRPFEEVYREHQTL